MAAMVDLERTRSAVTASRVNPSVIDGWGKEKEGGGHEPYHRALNLWRGRQLEHAVDEVHDHGPRR